MPIPIVLVHGIRLNRRCWVEVADRLAPEHEVVAVDLPGHGTRRGERFTLPSAVDAVRAGIDRAGGRALVVGHSLGGYAAMATAASAPDQVAGLIMAGSTLIPGPALATPFRMMHRLLSARADGGEAVSERVFARVLPPRVADEIARGGIATEAIPDVLHAFSALDPISALATYPGPTWLINGGHDHFRLHEQRFLAASAAGRLVVVPRAGHYLPLAHPGRFTDLVLDFAASCDQAVVG